MRYECRYDELVEIGSIKRNPCNPNRHSADQIQRLASVIERNGWRNPLVVSKRSGYLVKGEGRLLASMRLGCEVVPVEYQDYATDDEEWSDLIADNKIAELSEQDAEGLRAVVEKMNTVDCSATGFSQGEIDSLMGIMGNTPSGAVTEGQVFSGFEPMSYMEELMREELGDRRDVLGAYFTISFCFESKYEALKEYIRENGKEELEKTILQKAGLI